MSELRVVRGQPTAAETAAVLTVLLMLAGRHPAGTPAGSGRDPVSRWRTSALPAGRRPMPSPGPGAWRASALP